VIENDAISEFVAIFDSICSVDVNFTFGPSKSNAPGSLVESKVCFNSNSGCMMLDLPELFAPARTVRGAMSIVCSSAMDLNPRTVIALIDAGLSAIENASPLSPPPLRDRDESYYQLNPFHCQEVFPLPGKCQDDASTSRQIKDKEFTD